MNKDLVAYIAKELRFKDPLFIEKDLTINLLLAGLANDDRFQNNFVFKGGTCLIKSILHYYRFSEDLDFTYQHPENLTKLSSKQIENKLREIINETGELIQGISTKEGLDFKFEKDNIEYCQLSLGGRFTTFKVWFTSSITGMRNFIKIQFNFIEKIEFDLRTTEITILNPDLDKRIFVLFPGSISMKDKVALTTYSPEEFVCEKIRSILTRKGFKARDVLDLYYLHRSGYEYGQLEKETIAKTTFMLRYKKYNDNIKRDFSSMIDYSELDHITIEKVPEDFYDFAKDVIQYCKEKQTELLS